VYPGEDFFNLGNKVHIVCGEVSERISDVVDGWCRVACDAVKVRGSVLGCKKTFMDCCKALKDEAEPGVAVDSAVGCVEGGGEDLTEAVESGDSGPGQLRVRDGVVGERIGDVERLDVDVVNEAEEEFIGGRGLLWDAGVRKFEEWLAQQVGHGRKRGREVGKVRGRQFESVNGLGSGSDDEQGGSARKTR
jgi:hypothetical protein